MQCLIDADVLTYEVGFAAEVGNQGEGVPSFDYVAEILNNRIANIDAIAGACVEPQRSYRNPPPILYLTGKNNFRTEIAKRTPYKERPSNKPWHYKNIRAYIQSVYETRMVDGLEADDLMALHQTDDTIICTRDKDLRQVPGWHYGWELGTQPSFGPFKVEGFGEIQISNDKKKITGLGHKFFYAQCLVGDRVDTIPGLAGCGPVMAYNLLTNTKNEQDAVQAVRSAYAEKYGETGDEELLEQGRLLWMTRQLHDDGSPVLWEIPKFE